jgi:hypothetical protein
MKTPPVSEDFLLRVISFSKHSLDRKSDSKLCDSTCVRCEAERRLGKLRAAHLRVRKGDK